MFFPYLPPSNTPQAPPWWAICGPIAAILTVLTLAWVLKL